MSAKDCLKRIRLDLCLTQREFAEKINIKYGNYAHYESGSRNPSKGTIRQLVPILNELGFKVNFKDFYKSG